MFNLFLFGVRSSSLIDLIFWWLMIWLSIHIVWIIIILLHLIVLRLIYHILILIISFLFHSSVNIRILFFSHWRYNSILISILMFLWFLILLISLTVNEVTIWMIDCVINHIFLADQLLFFTEYKQCIAAQFILLRVSYALISFWC